MNGNGMASLTIGYQTVQVMLIAVLAASIFPHIDGLVQDCSVSNALAMETLWSCNKIGPIKSLNWLSECLIIMVAIHQQH